jgi:hypothetical protein
MHIDDLPIPEEMKEAIKNEMASQQMTIESVRHDIQRLFEELSMEHLLTLRHLFSHLVAAEDGRYAAYLEGTAAATLYHRFHVCPSCGKDHDKELLEAAHAELKQPEPAGDGAIQPSLFDQEQVAVMSIEDWFTNCAKYNVEAIPVEGDQGLPADPAKNQPVQCKNCEYKYVNLADRMIKEPGPENCEGCVNKTKWG